MTISLYLADFMPLCRKAKAHQAPSLYMTWMLLICDLVEYTIFVPGTLTVEVPFSLYEKTMSALEAKYDLSVRMPLTATIVRLAMSEPPFCCVRLDGAAYQLLY